MPSKILYAEENRNRIIFPKTEGEPGRINPAKYEKEKSYGIYMIKKLPPDS